jgi:L-fuculose-phosphate aldolase
MLISVYRWLRAYGLNDAHSGNASVRVAGTVLITPSGCCADTLRPADLLAAEPDAPPPPGASLDAPLHLAVYRQSPNTGAVLHSHGPHAIAMTMSGDHFTPVDFEGRYYFGTVPVLDIPFARYVHDSPGLVARALADSPVAVVRGHGIYARGASLDEAYKWTCSLEASARIAWLHRAVAATDSRA